MDTRPPVRSLPARIYAEIKARKVRKNMTIYLSAALTILGVTNLFMGVYKFTPLVFDLVLVLLLCGLPCAAIAAWIHGGEAGHTIRWKEAAAYSVFLVVAVVIVVRMVGTPRSIIQLPAGKSVAVLPFVNMSDDKEDEYFSDGVTEDIITQLSKIADLRVISRTSSMTYKGSKRSI